MLRQGKAWGWERTERDTEWGWKRKRRDSLSEIEYIEKDWTAWRFHRYEKYAMKIKL